MIRGRQRSRGKSGGASGPTETIVLAWDPLYKESTVNLTNFNKNAIATNNSWNVVLGTVAKPSPVTIPYGPWWYFEVTCWSTNMFIGICEETESITTIPYLGANAAGSGNTRSCGIHASSGSLYRDNSAVIAAGITYGLGDVIGVAYSLNNATARIKYYKNNVAVGSEYLASFFTGNFRPALAVYGVDTYGIISNNIYATPADTLKLGL